MTTKAYQLKITLRGARPPIWRRVEVLADTPLSMLHQVIQVAMGWKDSHLHQFVAKGKRYGMPGTDLGPGEIDESTVRLKQVLRKAKDRMVYEYDFGDGWQHEVLLEKLLPVETDSNRYPLVTGGKRACPPEDCGGLGGYYGLLEVLDDPDNPEYEEMQEWLGGRHDPARFDVEEANRVFRGVRSRTRPHP